MECISHFRINLGSTGIVMAAPLSPPFFLLGLYMVLEIGDKYGGEASKVEKVIMQQRRVEHERRKSKKGGCTQV